MRGDQKTLAGNFVEEEAVYYLDEAIRGQKHTRLTLSSLIFQVATRTRAWRSGRRDSRRNKPSLPHRTSGEGRLPPFRAVAVRRGGTEEEEERVEEERREVCRWEEWVEEERVEVCAACWWG